MLWQLETRSQGLWGDISSWPNHNDDQEEDQNEQIDIWRESPGGLESCQGERAPEERGQAFLSNTSGNLNPDKES